jgi:hypothetical protein
MIKMPDSITPGNIPLTVDGEPIGAVLGYADGHWPTAESLPRLFPKARHLVLTVLGGTLQADGVDCEVGNVTAAAAAAWVQRKLAEQPSSRPVVYADLLTPGYSMSEVIAELLKAGITRAQYRVLTAHYTHEPHICGQPCGVGFQADGTQWTDQHPGIGGALIDMSVLADGFFGDWVFGPVRGLVGTYGPHSLRLTWSSPGQTAPEAVHHYQVTVRLGGRDVRGFPADVPKTGVQESVQWDGVERGSYDEAMVRAVAVDGHASPWAVVRFPQ